MLLVTLGNLLYQYQNSKSLINTLQIKQAQLKKGFFTTGSGKEVILIMGSCRVAPYVWYFELLNERMNNRFTIHTIDPFNWNWNEKDERVDYNEVLHNLETDERLLLMIKSVNIFIHEYYIHAGMFNTQQDVHSLGIYHYGMSPSIDLCIPNWNDYFVLFGDIVSFDLEIRKKAIQDYNVLGKLSNQTEQDILAVRESNLKKFYEVCNKSSFKGFEKVFRFNLTRKRFFWTYNHVSNHFTFAIFMEIMFILGLQPETELCNAIMKEDMFANNFTYLTEYDIKWFGYDWGEEVKPLREKL